MVCALSLDSGDGFSLGTGVLPVGSLSVLMFITPRQTKEEVQQCHKCGSQEKLHNCGLPKYTMQELLQRFASIREMLKRRSFEDGEFDKTQIVRDCVRLLSSGERRGRWSETRHLFPRPGTEHWRSPVPVT